MQGSALSIPQQPWGSIPPRSGPLPWPGLTCSLLSYSLLALNTLKHPPKGSPGQVKEATPRKLQKMKCWGCWWRGEARCRSGQGCREAGEQELRKPTSGCSQPANLSEMLTVLPGLSLSTWVGCWGCRRFLSRVPASCFPWEGDGESPGGEPGGAQGPHRKGALKLHPQTCQRQLAELLTCSLA